MLLTTEQAAHYLSTKPAHINTLRKTGQLTSVQIGRFARYRQEDLDAYIESRVQKVVAKP